MGSLGAAIIGCGAIHNLHADAIVNNQMGHILWFVDIIEDRARTSANKYGGQWSTDYNEILKDPKVDVVHICTPHYLHYSMTMDALKAGKNVFVEKPVAINLEQARRMAETAKEADRMVTVSFQNRYNPTSVKAKEIIESGELGRIIGTKGLVTWFRDADYYVESGWRGSFNTEGGGVLINQSIHTLDLMQWLVGDVESVQGNVSTRTLENVIEVEDTADATLYFSNGARGIFYATNCYTQNSSVEIEIHMEKGILRIYNDQLLRVQEGKTEVIVDENSEKSPYKSYWGKSHDTLVGHFYKNIVDGNRDPIIPIEEGAKSLKILNGIYKSSSTGNRIKIV